MSAFLIRSLFEGGGGGGSLFTDPNEGPESGHFKQTLAKCSFLQLY
jgi:hypothetical protein